MPFKLIAVFVTDKTPVEPLQFAPSVYAPVKLTGGRLPELEAPSLPCPQADKPTIRQKHIEAVDNFIRNSPF